jgi:hypothetical protein
MPQAITKEFVMKLCVAIPMFAVAVALAGCKKEQTHSAFVVEDSYELHEAMLESYWAEHTDAATQRGAAMFPYHFLNGSSALNGLGTYEVGVLARGAANGPLSIYLARGDANDALFAARKDAVIDALVAAGASADSIRVTDKLSGGDGMDTDRVLFNAEREAEQTKPVYGAADSNDSSTGSSM